MLSGSGDSLKFLKVKSGLKAGNDGDPCAADWYRGYEDGHYDGFSSGYYGDRGEHRGSGGYSRPSSSYRPSAGGGGGRDYWLRHRQSVMG